jgi:serine/threonine protein kinase
MLGKGSYGSVRAHDGRAVKRFHKLTHLIQEYSAARYLGECSRTVKATNVNFEKLEMEMKLYDMSLRKWLDQNIDHLKMKDIDFIVSEILSGLAELHTRGLAHGDIKPGNILVKTDKKGNLTRCDLGDLGFTSVAKYSKVERTAAIYRDPVPKKTTAHDIFSIGIIMIELWAKVRVKYQGSYRQAREMAEREVKDSRWRNIILCMIADKHKERPSAVEVLKTLFNVTYEVPKRIAPTQINNLTVERQERIRHWMEKISDSFEIKRAKRGYKAMLAYCSTHNVSEEKDLLYSATMLFILASIFGDHNYRLKQWRKMGSFRRRHGKSLGKFKDEEIYPMLYNLLGDPAVIALVMY